MAKKIVKNNVKSISVKTDRRDKIIQSLLSFNASLISRADLLRGLSSSRLIDIETECGYPSDMTPADYKKMYIRNAVGSRVVRLLPEESWATSPEIYETEKTESTEFEKAVKEIIENKNIFFNLKRADILSGIGQFGVVLLGIDDGLELDKPVPTINPLTGESTKRGEHKLLFIRTFDQTVVQILDVEKDTHSPRYGLPTRYSIQFTDSIGNTTTTQTKTVHWTRLIHLADNRDNSDTYGQPRMQPVYNNLLDLIKTRGGGGEMFWKGGFPGISFETMPGMEDATIDETSLRLEMTKYMEGLQRYIALEGLSAKSLQPQIADPTGHIKANLQEICIALGCPLRIFMGAEAAQLASEQDKESWNVRLMLRRNEYISPMIIRPVFDRFMAMGCLPVVEKYNVWWPDLNEPTEKDKATIADLKTTALTKYVSGGVDALVPPKEYLTMIVGFTDEEAEAILQAGEDYIQDEDNMLLRPNLAKPNLTGEGNSVKAGKSLIDTTQDGKGNKTLPTGE